MAIPITDIFGSCTLEKEGTTWFNWSCLTPPTTSIDLVGKAGPARAILSPTTQVYDSRSNSLRRYGLNPTWNPLLTSSSGGYFYNVSDVLYPAFSGLEILPPLSSEPSSISTTYVPFASAGMDVYYITNTWTAFSHAAAGTSNVAVLSNVDPATWSWDINLGLNKISYTFLLLSICLEYK